MRFILKVLIYKKVVGFIIDYRIKNMFFVGFVIMVGFRKIVDDSDKFV